MKARGQTANRDCHEQIDGQAATQGDYTMTMVKDAVRFALVAASALAMSVVASEARDIKVQRKASPAAIAASAPDQIAASAPVAWMAAPINSSPTVSVEPAVPACARKVKVIYAGYGEASRAAPCTLASN